MATSLGKANVLFIVSQVLKTQKTVLGKPLAKRFISTVRRGKEEQPEFTIYIFLTSIDFSFMV